EVQLRHGGPLRDGKLGLRGQTRWLTLQDGPTVTQLDSFKLALAFAAHCARVKHRSPNLAAVAKNVRRANRDRASADCLVANSAFPTGEASRAKHDRCDRVFRHLPPARSLEGLVRATQPRRAVVKTSRSRAGATRNGARRGRSVPGSRAATGHTRV